MAEGEKLPPDAGSVKLVVLTIALSILYILSFRYIELPSNRLFTTGITFVVPAVLFLIRLGILHTYLKNTASRRMMTAV